MNTKLLTLRDSLLLRLSTTRLRAWLPSRGTILFTLFVAFCLIGTSGVWAAPQSISSLTATSTGSIAYQGRLADASGAPLTGTYIIVFRLYNVASGGSPLWEESWTGANSVQVNGGLFNVMLGSLTPIPQNVINGNSSLWLGVDVGTDAEMTPRVQLGSVPYAIQSQHAERANGLSAPDGDPADAVIVGNNGYVGIGTTNPAKQLDIRGSIFIAEPIGAQSGVTFTYADGGAGTLNFSGGRYGQNWNWQSGSPTGTKTQMHLYGGGDSSNTYLELYRSDQQGSPNVVLNANGNTYFMGGNVGIGTTNPGNPLEMGSGAYVSSGGVWINVSDRNLKENFRAIDGKSLLEKVASLPISEWNYKAENNRVKHIGPVAQDFYAAFNLGEDDKHISTVDASGVALAAIQSLDQQVKEQDSRIVALQQQNAILQQQNAALDTRLAALERSSGAPIGPAAGSLSGWNLVALAVAAGMLVAALIVRRGYSQKRGI